LLDAGHLRHYSSMDGESIKATPQLDPLIAEKVMGESLPHYCVDAALSRFLPGETIKSEKGCWVLVCEYERSDIPEWQTLPLSTEIAAARQVVKKLLTLTEQQDMDIEHRSEGTESTWGVSTWYKDGGCKDWKRAENGSLPIRMTVLKAVERQGV
jgi:hypothetical protein